MDPAEKQALVEKLAKADEKITELEKKLSEHQPVNLEPILATLTALQKRVEERDDTWATKLEARLSTLMERVEALAKPAPETPPKGAPPSEEKNEDEDDPAKPKPPAKSKPAPERRQTRWI